MQIVIDHDSDETLQSQIVRQVCALIEHKILPQGCAMPASRQLSKQLNLARNTVTAAYDVLVSLGYLYTEHGVGTFVCLDLPQQKLKTDLLNATRQTGESCSTLNLPLPYTGRGVSGMHKPTPNEVCIDFVSGRSEPDAFPEKAWRRIVSGGIGRLASGMSEYHDPAGLPLLRQLIVSMLGPARNMIVAREQVLLVAGFQQGINLAAHLFVSNGTRVAMEAPSYRGAAFLFESYGGDAIPIPLDDQGIDVSQLPGKNIKFVYVTPSHQFPTGITMSLNRRLALLKWAADTGAYILEVDHGADYRYEGSQLPSIQSMDENGCVIYLNSFSRSIGPGLRIGYMVVPRDLIGTACRIKSLMDNGLPWLDQATLAQFIRNGDWEHHLKKLRMRHQRRRDTLLATLREYIPESHVSGDEAGTHVLLTLPEEYKSANEVLEHCQPLGVGVHSLENSPAWFYEHLSDHQRMLLLGYTHLTENQIEHGIRTLASTFTAS